MKVKCCNIIQGEALCLQQINTQKTWEDIFKEKERNG